MYTLESAGQEIHFSFVHICTALKIQQGLEKLGFWKRFQVFFRFLIFKCRKETGHNIMTLEEHPICHFPAHIIFYKLWQVSLI